MQKLIAYTHRIQAAAPANYSGAALTQKYVGLKGYRRVQIVLQTGAWAGGTAAVTLLQATSQAGAGEKALAFAKQWNDAASEGVFVETAVTSNTFNLAAADTQYIIEVDATELDIDNGFAYVAVDVASPGANADYYSGEYRLFAPRQARETMENVLS